MCGENPTFCNLGMGELQLSEGGWLENGHSYVVTSRATSGASKFRGASKCLSMKNRRGKSGSKRQMMRAVTSQI